VHNRDEKIMKPCHPKLTAALLALFLGIPVSFAPTSDREEKNGGVNRFTIAVLPDTQNYVDNTKPQPVAEY
jgi:hypothetical protein